MLNNRKKQGLVVILSSPSGGGKSSIAKALLEKDLDLVVSVSATTREPRAGEIEGKEYFFKSREEFLRMIENDELLEYSEIYGNLYGIPKGFVKSLLTQGNSIILDIDSQGAYKIKKIFKNSVLSIFIIPPSLEELRKRITARNRETPAEIKVRMNLASSEIEQAKNYDYVVLNDNFVTTTKNIYEIIRGEKIKRGIG